MDVTSKEGNLEANDGDKKRPLIKPTKYHYYPHNQHLYLLPECATQQVSFPYTSSIFNFEKEYHLFKNLKKYRISVELKEEMVKLREHS